MKLLKNLKWGGVIQLNKIASYQTVRVPYSDIQADSYISTENMLQDCEGVIPYDGNPNTNSVIGYQKGDILVSNIRPYLQKIWLADRDGGCNPDVLVIRIDDASKYDPRFVYYTLRRKAFFDHMMTDKSGVKMPRGNKVNNLRFTIPNIPLDEQLEIISIVTNMERQISKAKENMAYAQKQKIELFNKYMLNLLVELK